MGEIPTKVLKECEFTFNVLTKCANKYVDTVHFSIFPKISKCRSVFKKEDPLEKSNYQPVCILPLLSKVYERVIYITISDYSDNYSFMNNILCGFRKINNTEYALFKLLLSWQQVLDHVGFISTIVIRFLWFLIPMISYIIIYWFIESFFGPLLFNIFINDLFFSIKN